MRKKTDDFGLAILDFGLWMPRKLWISRDIRSCHGRGVFGTIKATFFGSEQGISVETNGADT